MGDLGGDYAILYTIYVFELLCKFEKAILNSKSSSLDFSSTFTHYAHPTYIHVKTHTRTHSSLFSMHTLDLLLREGNEWSFHSESRAPTSLSRELHLRLRVTWGLNQLINISWLTQFTSHNLQTAIANSTDFKRAKVVCSDNSPGGGLLSLWIQGGSRAEGQDALKERCQRHRPGNEVTWGSRYWWLCRPSGLRRKKSYYLEDLKVNNHSFCPRLSGLQQGTPAEAPLRTPPKGYCAQLTSTDLQLPAWLPCQDTGDQSQFQQANGGEGRNTKHLERHHLGGMGFGLTADFICHL